MSTRAKRLGDYLESKDWAVWDNMETTLCVCGKDIESWYCPYCGAPNTDFQSDTLKLLEAAIAYALEEKE